MSWSVRISRQAESDIRSLKQKLLFKTDRIVDEHIRALECSPCIGSPTNVDNVRVMNTGAKYEGRYIVYRLNPRRRTVVVVRVTDSLE